MALEGRAAVEQDDEQVEEDDEQEQNAPPSPAVLSVDTVVPLPVSRDIDVDTGDAGAWEGSSGWLCGGEWGS